MPVPSLTSRSLGLERRSPCLWLLLLLWGIGFFAYMSSIPHKGVRYLIPTAIPVVVIAAVGIKAGWHWVSQRGAALRVVFGLLAAALVVNDWLRSFSMPWINPATVLGCFIRPSLGRYRGEPRSRPPVV